MTQSFAKIVVLGALVALPSTLAAQRDTVRSSVLTGIELKKVYSSVNRFEAQDPAAAFAQHLYPPELVMQHQSRLKLTEQQRNVIVQEINRLQATAVHVQWRVADESEKLNELLGKEGTPEADILTQAERMMTLEVAVKRAQLSMLIRIRNILTPEQRGMLQELRKRE
jgi:Spy/CpxP family protein refolding chaperone